MRHRTRSIVSCAADHDHLSFFNERVQVVAHERGDVRYLLLDVAPVGPDQCSQPDVRIENSHSAPFAEERFNERDDGTLSQVIRTRFERESDDTDSLLA